MTNIGNSWDQILVEDFESESFLSLNAYLDNEKLEYNVFPQAEDVFSALKCTDYKNVKVVILGQDPYHEKGQAHGLCFSVPSSIQAPPSLRNIFKELKSDIGVDNTSPCLMPWALQGVLLLNTVLTVREGQANSHKNVGWETLTNSLISHLNARDEPIVFILWGANARAKKTLITNNDRHLVLESVHPSPLSAYGGFFGNKHFSKTNEFLTEHGVDAIDWRT